MSPLISTIGVPFVVVQLYDAFVIALKLVGAVYLTSIFLVDFTFTYFEESEAFPIPEVVVPPKRTELSTKIGKSPFAESLKS